MCSSQQITEKDNADQWLNMEKSERNGNIAVYESKIDEVTI